MSDKGLTEADLYQDWQYEVANKDTRLGFIEWLENWDGVKLCRSCHLPFVRDDANFLCSQCELFEED